ncbi:unnamed protein product [Rhizophagus irregularis]|nr:unnamed protein product [Rhizophagus irregularis]
MATSELEEQETNVREFFHDYPNSKFITGVYYSGQKRKKKIVHVYEIISLGYYPTYYCKKTQKSGLNTNEYDIPDDYVVKTELWKTKITLKTKYYNSKDVKFSLSFHDNGDLKTIESKKSGSDLIKLFCKKRNFSPSTNVSVTYLFGFDVIILEKLRWQAVSKNKRPYDLISNSQQNRRLSALGKDIESTVTPLFHEYNFISSETNSPAKLLEVKIEINGQIILFVFDDSNKNSKLEITVRMCDEILLSRDGYREMAKIYPDLIRNYKIEECRLKISKEMEELVPINVFNMERELLSSTDDIDNSIINEIGNGIMILFI